MNSYQTDYPVMDLSGRFVGVLTRARLIYALKEIGPDARIVDVMIGADAVPVCTPQQDLSEIWEVMMGGGGRVVAVKRRYSVSRFVDYRRYYRGVSGLWGQTCRLRKETIHPEERRWLLTRDNEAK